MNVLSLELSSSRRSVAVWNPQSQGAPVLVVAPPAPARQGTSVFALIESALTQAGIGAQDISHVAVGLGPGSYTGIRAAISAAQGWAASHQVSLLGIPATDTLLEQLRSSGVRGEVVLAFDAQRGELYAGTFGIETHTSVVLSPLRLMSVADARALQESGRIVHGPDLGALLPEARPLFPCAASQANVCARETERYVHKPEELAPVYLRETSFVKLPAFRTGQAT